MLTIEKELEVMRLYFNGELKGKSLVEFEQQFQKDPDFRLRVFREKMIFEAMYGLTITNSSSSADAYSSNALLQARNLADQLEEDLFEEDFLEDFEVDIDITPTYSLQELLDFFKPIEHFETANRRSSSAQANGLDDLVLTPMNEMDCRNFRLNFQLTEALPFDLELTIMNNHEEILYTQIIEANTLIFKASLFFLQSKAGKYYWRLKANTRDRVIRKKYISVVRSFFLKKHLNPYQSH
ncbi:MAG: hypothetical protein R3E32_27155 [Chitinophagales bacterium]